MSTATNQRIQEYWDWVAVALFLLITVDLLTSIYAAGVVGTEYEHNPLMAWLLGQPLSLLLAAHIVVAILATLGFRAIFGLIRQSEGLERTVLQWTTEVYLGLLVAVGLFVFANNLAVIVLGDSLLS
jgi:hypothetical protein